MEEQKIEFSREEEERIRVFMDTYNAQYIENFSSAKLDHIKNATNPVYQKLIDNLSTQRTYLQYKLIEGPYTVHKFKMEVVEQPKKSFFIFGEVHRNSFGHCMLREDILDDEAEIEFPEYLRLLSIQSPAFIDFYFEEPFAKNEYTKHTKEVVQQLVKRMFQDVHSEFKTEYDAVKKLPSLNSSNSSTFNGIRTKFKNCIQPKFRNVPECQIMRIHNIDIRNTHDFEDEFPPDYGLSLLIQIIKQGTSVEQIFDVIKRVNQQTSLIMSNLLLISTGNILEYFLLNKRLKTELQKRTYERENIEWFIQYKIGNISHIPIHSIAKLLFDSINDNQFNWTLKQLKEGELVFMKLEALKADMYALSRIFKFYDIKKNNPIGAFQPVESKNIIIYAGNVHCETYVEFLRFLSISGERRGIKVTQTYQYLGSKDVSCASIEGGEPVQFEERENLFYIPER